MEKFFNIFKNKEKRIENLIFLLIVLVITLLILNNILDKEESADITIEKISNLENDDEKIAEVDDNLEIELEGILKKIRGVSDVDVLIRYQETEEIIPIYNENNTKSKIEEGEEKNKKITEEVSSIKNIIITDDKNVIVQKIISPKIEGAIVIAKGAENVTVKSNIISAVEAVTGLALHKIQVFEMGD